MQSLKYKIAVISSVPPDPNLIAGALILHRWLDHPQINWTYIEAPKQKRGFIWRILDRFTRSRFHKLARPLRRFCEINPIRVLLESRQFKSLCLNKVDELQPDIILSVAHGPFYKIAYRVSQQTQVPLLLLAQDWWPAFIKGGLAKKRKEEAIFKHICSQSAATIAVSEGMREELGCPPNTSVIHDIPSVVQSVSPISARSSEGPLQVIYAGNLSTYGPMVEQAARACMESDLVRLEIFGKSPIRWSAGTEEAFKSEGIYRGFVAPEDFPNVAADYDFVLAIMSFAPELQQRMRTCFLSKIIELAQRGKPIIIWGPEDSSACAWARKTGAALSINDPSPEVLRSALEKLAQDAAEQNRLAAAIRTAAANEFDPAKIRCQFMAILEKVALIK
jgi:hypothetical protein